jgi:hypothetical protein
VKIQTQSRVSFLESWLAENCCDFGKGTVWERPGEDTAG